jgi:prepilin-type N-terminal cleavage/methylation domain-containing protein/prepilin-type processing-associated H-X9-DG protein
MLLYLSARKYPPRVVGSERRRAFLGWSWLSCRGQLEGSQSRLGIYGRDEANLSKIFRNLHGGGIGDREGTGCYWLDAEDPVLWSRMQWNRIQWRRKQEFASMRPSNGCGAGVVRRSEIAISLLASSPPPSEAPRRGFTLVELLVAIAIIAVLAALLLPTLASAKVKARRVACLNNMRQVGLAFNLYIVDSAGRLPNPKATNTFDFNSPNAPDNPLKLLRSFVGLNDPRAAAPVYVCPSAQAATKTNYAPVGISSTALMINQVVLNWRTEGLGNPARTVFIQENYALMSYLWYQPANLDPDPSSAGHRYSRWHMWTGSDAQQWSGTKREHYCNLHQQGGNLVWADAHVSYKVNSKTSSLDWGLLDSAGADSPWEPTLAHSCAIYTYR